MTACDEYWPSAPTRTEISGMKRSHSDQTLVKASSKASGTALSEQSHSVTPLNSQSRCSSACLSEQGNSFAAEVATHRLADVLAHPADCYWARNTICEDAEQTDRLGIVSSAIKLPSLFSSPLAQNFAQDDGSQLAKLALAYALPATTYSSLLPAQSSMKKSKSCMIPDSEPIEFSESILAKSDGESHSGSFQRKKPSNHLSHGPAAVELFFRLNHARQTLDFAKRQASLFAALEKAELNVWEALTVLNELREYEAALFGGDDLAPDMSMQEHAFQTAELCRLRYPDDDWLHLVGLIHGLGKLLAHPRFGSQPQWAVCGESFPLGCRFDTHISCSQFFSVNPDRRKRAYNTQLGIYEPGCSLANVYMSWSGSEYLYLALMLNQTLLPDSALFLIRYQKFHSLLRPGNGYRALLSEQDEAHLPLLEEFQSICQYKRQELPPGTLEGQDFYDYYNGLIEKYIGGDKLFW